MKAKSLMTQPKLVKKIFLFGGGLHSQTCIDAIEQQGKYQLVGIIDSIKEKGTFVDGYKVLGRLDDLSDLIKEYDTHSGFIGIGTNWVRKKLSKEINKLVPTFEFVNIIHPTATFGKNVLLGKGILIGALTFISSSCIIGNFCLLHQKSHLGLHNHIGDYASVSLGSIIGGKVKIGMCSAITIGVVIHDRINIGSNSVIGSGSLVLKDIPDNVVCYGQPAKIIRNRKENEPYLRSG